MSSGSPKSDGSNAMRNTPESSGCAGTGGLPGEDAERLDGEGERRAAVLAERLHRAADRGGGVGRGVPLAVEREAVGQRASLEAVEAQVGVDERRRADVDDERRTGRRHRHAQRVRPEERLRRAVGRHDRREVVDHERDPALLGEALDVVRVAAGQARAVRGDEADAGRPHLRLARPRPSAAP